MSDGAVQPERIETGAPGRRVVWRRAGNSGPHLILMHGGFGSWTHWARNIGPLSQVARVLAPDTPGLGESDLVEPLTIETIAEPLCSGIDALLGPDTRFTIAAFSFGAVVAGGILGRIGSRVDRLIVVGGGGLGVPRAPMADLESWRHLTDPAAIRATQRRNLELLMFHDKAAIDDTAIDYQTENTRMARVNSRKLSRGDALAQALKSYHGEVHGIWGAEDPTARGYFEGREAVLKAADPEGTFQLLPGVGHWAQYEGADAVNAAIADLISRPPRRG